jgi:aldose 1-epimerase
MPGGGAYMGATCGRVANRITGAAFELDGVRYTLSANEGANQRHGGAIGFDRADWEVVAADRAKVTLRHCSPEGDQGFPGRLEVTADFALSEDGELSIVYEAATDRPTHVNIVSHGYFNLSGAKQSVADHRLRVDAARFLPVDAAQLPGDPIVVAGTPLDFTRMKGLEQLLASAHPQVRLSRGGNHNFCLNGTGLREVAWLQHPPSGRTLTLSTDQSGLQLYLGGWLGGAFAPHSGVCLEAQAWPDACNRPHFPSTRLDPGRRYRSETRLRFGVARGSRLG